MHFKSLASLSLIFLAACQTPVSKPIETVVKPAPITHPISGTVSIGASFTSSSLPSLNDADVIPGRIILEFKPGLRLQSLSPLQARVQGQTRTLIPVRLLAQGATLYGLPGATSSETVRAAQTLNTRTDVLYAEPDRHLHALQTSQTSSLAANAVEPPNDPLFPDAWWLTANPGSLNALNAWQISTGSGTGPGLGETVIAVIDTGIAVKHPDLQAKILPGYDFISDSTNAADGDGRDSNPDDPGDAGQSFHGSHVAGLAAASSNNGIGMTGVSWGSRLLPIRMLGFDGGTLSDFIDALLWSAGLPVAGVPNNQHPATVINASLGGSGSCSSATQSAIHRAIQAGSSVMIAAGNEAQDAWASSPGNCDGVITVGASESGGALATYSNTGARLDVIAPGGSAAKGLTSTIKTPTGQFGYGVKQGTSMATPLVSGTVALVKSVNPNLTPAQIRSIITSSIQPLLGCSPSSTGTCASGLLDATKALQATKALPLAAQADFDLQVSTAIVGNSSSTATINVPFQAIAWNGFTQAITWTFEPASSGIGGSFVTPSSSSGTANTLTLNTATTKPGVYTVRIKGSSGAGANLISRSAKVLVQVVGVNPGPVTPPKPNPPSLKDVKISAFFMVNDTQFDSSKIKDTFSDPTTGAFSLNDLEDGAYLVSAWKDIDGDGKISFGDGYGIYRQVGSIARVKPPFANVSIQLEKYPQGAASLAGLPGESLGR
jgi:serine protease